MTEDELNGFLATFAEYCYSLNVPEEKASLSNAKHICEDCGATFDKVQGLNAHRRFCKEIKVTANGK